MKWILISKFLFVWMLPFALPHGASAAESDTGRVGSYRTREERREAGLGTALTGWLTFSGLVEVEALREVTQFDVGLSDHYDYATDPAVQAAFDLSFLEIFEAELILEYTEDGRDPIMDELIVAADVGDIGFSVGRFYTPFGLYYSHFINGPLLEFTETRRDMFQVDYDFEDRIEFFVFAFDGITREFGKSSNDIGWGYGADAFFMNGRLNVGFGYQSNIAESDEEYLREENHIYRNKVGAWNLYGVYEADSWDVSFEAIKATGRFYEFDRVEDKPESWNLEAAYFPRDLFPNSDFLNNNVEIAFRYERSKELIDEPERQVGVALTWRLFDKVSMTAEYLRADYRKNFVEEDDDIFATARNNIALWFAFEF